MMMMTMMMMIMMMMIVMMVVPMSKDHEPSGLQGLNTFSIPTRQNKHPIDDDDDDDDDDKISSSGDSDGDDTGFIG